MEDGCIVHPRIIEYVILKPNCFPFFFWLSVVVVVVPPLVLITTITSLLRLAVL